MISIHRDLKNIGLANKYWRGFEPVDFGADLERLAHAITVYPWSHIQFLGGGRRKADNFGRALYCPLDFDKGQMTLDDAKRIFAPYYHVIGLTKSHQVDKDGQAPCDRFRVILRFDSPIEDRKYFQASMYHWVHHFFGTDEKCKDAARFFWPCTQVVQYSATGKFLEIIPPSKQRRAMRNYAAISKARIIPSYLHNVLKNGCPEGERNNTCFRLGAELTRCGFSYIQVLDIVAHSAISLPDDELITAVSNGIKAASTEART